MELKQYCCDLTVLHLLFFQVARNNKWCSLSPSQFLLLWGSVFQWLKQCNPHFTYGAQKKTKELMKAMTREQEMLREDLKKNMKKKEKEKYVLKVMEN